MRTEAPARPPRDSASEQRRAQILEAALQCFRERGLQATTIEHICERSGASNGSLYHYFGGKEQLARALFLEILGRFEAGALAELQRHRTARAGIQAIVVHHVRWFQRNRDLARYLLIARGSTLIGEARITTQDARRPFVVELHAWLEPFRARGQIVTLPFSVFSSIWIGPAQEFATQWLTGTASTSPEKAAPVLADAAWRALRRAKR